MGKYFPPGENSVRRDYDGFCHPSGVRPKPLENKNVVSQLGGRILAWRVLAQAKMDQRETCDF
jgi:hypothetical protein